MNILIPLDSFESSNNYDVVQAVINFVNSLRKGFFYLEEIPTEALESYYVDYYLQQVNNGGFAQFVYNSGWKEELIYIIRSGLGKVGANKHSQLFNRQCEKVNAMGDKLAYYLGSDFLLGDDKFKEIRRELSENDDYFYRLNKEENLVELNRNFILSLPNLKVLDEKEYQSELKMYLNSLPNPDQRKAEARVLAENRELSEIKIIQNLCDLEGQEFLRLNAITIGEYIGERVKEWHITTSSGHHYVVFLDEKALLFSGKSKDILREVSI